MKKFFSLLALMLLCSVGAWAEGIPTDGKVYTIKAHFTSNHNDLYLSNNGSTNLQFPTAVTANQSYWVARIQASGRPWKFQSGYGDGRYLDGNATGALSETGRAMTISAVNTNYFHFQADINAGVRYLGTWNNTHDPGFGTWGGCYGSKDTDNTWTTNYTIEEVPNVEVYTVNTNAYITVNIDGYTGLTKVRNGGLVIVPSGTTLNESNINADGATTFAIDADAHTITAQFESTTVTYKFTNILDEQVSVDAAAVIGKSAEDYIPTGFFYNATGVSEADKVVSNGNKTFTVTGSWNLPFVLGNVYYLRDRLQSNGTPQYYSKSNGTNAPSREASSSFDKSFLWSFEAVAGTLDQFYLKNLLSGYINTNGNSASTFNANSGTAMRIYEYVGTNHTTGADFGFVMPDGSNEVYGDHQGSKLGYWSGNTYADKMKNEGSAFQVQAVDFASLLTAVPYGDTFLTSGESGKYYDAAKKAAAVSAPTVANAEAVIASAQDYNIAPKALDPSKYYRLANYDTSRSHNNWVGTTNEAGTDGNVLRASERKVKSNVADGGVAALWQFEESDGAYYIKNMNSGTCIFNSTENDAHVEMPIDKSDAGTFIIDNVSGKWWRIKTKTANEWLHQSNLSDNKLLLWSGTPSLTGSQASLWSLEEVETLPFTFNAATYYATFCSPVNLEIPSGVYAYIATSVHGYEDFGDSNDYLFVEQLTGYIPANTGVLLIGTPGATVNFPIAAANAVLPNVEANKFVGTTIPRQGFAEDSHYGLRLYEGKAVLAKNGTVANVPANKAILPVEATPASSNVLGFRFGDDVLTSIKSATTTNNIEFYDLNGKRVMNPTTGIYVTRDGRKVFVK